MRKPLKLWRVRVPEEWDRIYDVEATSAERARRLVERRERRGEVSERVEFIESIDRPADVRPAWD